MARQGNPELEALLTRRFGFHSWFTQAVRKANNVTETAIGLLVNRSQLMQNRINDAIAKLDCWYNALNKCLQGIYAIDLTNINVNVITEVED
jgi:hypothetical protein